MVLCFWTDVDQSTLLWFSMIPRTRWDRGHQSGAIGSVVIIIILISTYFYYGMYAQCKYFVSANTFCCYLGWGGKILDVPYICRVHMYDTYVWCCPIPVTLTSRSLSITSCLHLACVTICLCLIHCTSSMCDASKARIFLGLSFYELVLPWTNQCGIKINSKLIILERSYLMWTLLQDD